MKGKILAGMTDDSVTLSQLNPRETITFKRRAILSMHRGSMPSNCRTASARSGPCFGHLGELNPPSPF